MSWRGQQRAARARNQFTYNRQAILTETTAIQFPELEQELFERIVEQCMIVGLVRGEQTSPRLTVRGECGCGDPRSPVPVPAGTFVHRSSPSPRWMAALSKRTWMNRLSIAEDA